MDEDVLNMQIRKFLKKVGITSQREIEGAVRVAMDQGKLRGSEKLNASVVLRMNDIDLEVAIDDTIALE